MTSSKTALSLSGYRFYFATHIFAMMADNIEHVISYWVCFQKFHSPALGGFAVVSHWLPFLAFSVAVGALNDRFDSRRLIQCGMALFVCASLAWGFLMVTDTLTIPKAMAILVMHGCAGVLWQTSSQMLLYDIVAQGNEGPPRLLASAVRLNATARYLGVLVGPAVGALMMITLGPTRGIFANTLFYIPLIAWLVRAPYGRAFRKGAPPKRAVRGLADVLATVREVRGIPVLVAMILLAGGASFFVGNSYQAQMPAFAADLGHGDPGTAYSVLLAADAAGALIAGVLLETRGGFFETKATSAIVLAMCWSAALFGFACVRTYPIAVAFLFCAGFFELSFSSMTQTLVQMNAPEASRGRVLGLFNMSSLGMRMFSGVTVGLAGTLATVHVSLAASAVAFATVMSIVLARLSARPLRSPPPDRGSRTAS